MPGTEHIDFWHGLSNFPQIIEATFTVFAPGEQFTLWNGDIITVTDQNGWTAKFMWTPLSSVQWALVPGSIRDANGNPVAADDVEPNPGSPLAPSQYALAAAGVTITIPGGTSMLIIPFNIASPSLPQGIVTVTQLYDNLPPAQLCPDLLEDSACASNP